jgi:hypothetical protein
MEVLNQPLRSATADYDREGRLEGCSGGEMPKAAFEKEAVVDSGGRLEERRLNPIQFLV